MDTNLPLPPPCCLHTGCHDSTHNDVQAGIADVGNSTVTKVTGLVWLPEILTLPWSTCGKHQSVHFKSCMVYSWKLGRGVSQTSSWDSQLIPMMIPKVPFPIKGGSLVVMLRREYLVTIVTKLKVLIKLCWNVSWSYSDWGRVISMQCIQCNVICVSKLVVRCPMQAAWCFMASMTWTKREFAKAVSWMEEVCCRTLLSRYCVYLYPMYNYTVHIHIQHREPHACLLFSCSNNSNNSYNPKAPLWDCRCSHT